jgi:hypothetical protein
MKTIKKTAIKTKNHLNRNKTSYALGAVAIAAIALQQRNLRTFKEFLIEKGIDPIEFFTPEYYAELNS